MTHLAIDILYKSETTIFYFVAYFDIFRNCYSPADRRGCIDLLYVFLYGSYLEFDLIFFARNPRLYSASR